MQRGHGLGLTAEAERLGKIPRHVQGFRLEKQLAARAVPGRRLVVMRHTFVHLHKLALKLARRTVKHHQH